MAVTTVINHNLTVISTFSGFGGSSLGYHRAGFNVIAAVELIDHAAKTYTKNFPNTKMYNQDIRNVGTNLLTDLNLKRGELTILDGSPPCKVFSSNSGIPPASRMGIAELYRGKVKQRADNLVFEQIRLAKILNPKVVIMENVTGMTRGHARFILENSMVELKNLGYQVKAKILNACHYGAGTSRSRVFMLGIRNDLDIVPSFPHATGKITTSKEAIKIKPTKADLQEIPSFQNATFHKRVFKETRSGITHDEHWDYSILDPNKPAKTIITDPKIFSPENRWLAISEILQLSSFPHDYYAGESYRQKYENVGLSVPPCLTEAIGNHIKNLLKL